MRKVWHTEHGPRRVRQEPPSLDEAVFAARGLSEDPREQAEIAASLMGVPVEEAWLAIRRSTQRKDVGTVTFTRRAGGERAVVVERKPSRRLGTYRRLG